MRDFLWDAWRFIRRRDSESACCLMIVLSRWLSEKDTRQMRDYLQALLELETAHGDLCHHCNGTGMRRLPSSTVTNTAAKCIPCGGTGWLRWP